MIKIPINVSFVIVFHVKIQHKKINLSFYIIFASKKLPRHEISKNNYQLNETIIFLLSWCVVSYHWSKKVLPQTLALEQLILEPRTCGFELDCFTIELIYQWPLYSCLLLAKTNTKLHFRPIGRTTLPSKVATHLLPA